jgi:hypothetical protein
VRRIVVAGTLTLLTGTAAAIPADTDPCKHPRYWPHAVRSTTLPIEVHYPRAANAKRAFEVLAILERDWAIEVDQLGFRAPRTGGKCGSDDALDVFLWPGRPDGYTNAIDPIDGTPEDDWTTYMVLDPDGEFGGEQLPSTLAHELNHMCQASDDWDESIALLEATSTFVEATIEPALGARVESVADFQAEPGWSIDHDDDYDSWFMYGAELYLEVLRDAYFDGDPAGIGDLWRRMRNSSDDAAPSWADAVAAAVAPATLDDTIVDLAVWRWYVGPHDDGHHLAGAAELPAPEPVGAAAPGTRKLALGRIDPLGTAYVSLSGGSATVRVHGLPRGLTVRMLAIPGTAGADADELIVRHGTAAIDASDAPRTLAVVVVPKGAYDPEDPPAAATLDLRLSWSAH